MAIANRKPSFLATMAWEGRSKLSMDPRDAGNWTGGRVGVGKLVGSKFGVSAAVAARMGKIPAELSEDDALKIFVDGYWTPIGADIMAAGVDHAVSDDAYNAGAGSAMGRWRRGGWTKASDPVATIHAYCARRLSFLEALLTWRIYRIDWARRVAGVEAESIKMAHSVGAALPQAHLADLPDDLVGHLNAKSHEADARARGSRMVAALAGAVAVLAPAVAPQGGAGMIAVAALATAAAVHQLYSGHVQACRRDALGEAAETA